MFTKMKTYKPKLEEAYERLKKYQTKQGEVKKAQNIFIAQKENIEREIKNGSKGLTEERANEINYLIGILK